MDRSDLVYPEESFGTTNANRIKRAQEIRMRRFFLGCLAYAAGAFIVGLLLLNGFLSLNNFLWFLALVVALNGLLFTCFATGFNLHFKDPSLTIPQILLATVILMQITYLSDGGRGVLLLLYLTSHIFGVFKLNLRQFLILDLITIVAYGLVILLLLKTRPEAIDLKLEMLHWAALLIILFAFAGVGAYLNRLRSTLHDRNLRLNRALAKNQELAIKDELTGLYNRRYILDTLTKERERTERSGGTFCLALLDLDMFKEINDTFGHLAGDTVLKRFSILASGVLRTTDTIGRYGGEEFLLLMPHTDIDSAHKVLERIRSQAEQTEYTEVNPGLYVHVSIGVAEYEPGMSIETLLNHVDMALYDAKNAGRNRIAVGA